MHHSFINDAGQIVDFLIKGHAVAFGSAEWRQKKQLECNGILYEIRVGPFADSNFRATWFCGECSEQGEWSPIATTIDGAMHLAEIGIGVHHNSFMGIFPIPASGLGSRPNNLCPFRFLLTRVLQRAS